MSSLYNIDCRLQKIFDELEENGGELTEELAKELEITEEELKDKLINYRNYINSLKGDVESCKCEETRIRNNRKIKENVIDRLKERVKDAVIKYGNEGKSGNKVIDVFDGKFYTKSTNSIEIDEEKANLFIYCIKQAIKDNHHVQNTDIYKLIEVINGYAQTMFEKPDNYFSIDDLRLIKLRVSHTYTIEELLKPRGIFNDIKDCDNFNASEFDMSIANSKEDLKLHINAGDLLSMVSIKDSTAIIIK